MKLGDGAADIKTYRSPVQEPGVSACGSTSAYRGKSAADHRLRIPIPCPSLRRSSISPSPTKRWTCGPVRKKQGHSPGPGCFRRRHKSRTAGTGLRGYRTEAKGLLHTCIWLLRSFKIFSTRELLRGKENVQQKS